jgi:uncharacterized protein YcnI
MQGKVADDATEIAFKAYQTYQDGSVVEWIGAPDSEKPTSVTTVNPKPADGSDDHHGTTESTSLCFNCCFNCSADIFRYFSKKTWII